MQSLNQDNNYVATQGSTFDDTGTLLTESAFIDSGILVKPQPSKAYGGDLDDSMEQIGEGEMASSGEEGDQQDMLKRSKKEYHSNNIPKPGASDDEDDQDEDEVEDDAEEVCLTRADIKEMQKIHEELELENEKLKAENQSMKKQVEEFGQKRTTNKEQTDQDDEGLMYEYAQKIDLKEREFNNVKEQLEKRTSDLMDEKRAIEIQLRESKETVATLNQKLNNLDKL